MYPHSKCLLSTYHGFYGLPGLENKKKTEKRERERENKEEVVRRRERKRKETVLGVGQCTQGRFVS